MIFEDERIDEINDSLRLIQKKSGLTFGTDAYLLYAYLKKKPMARAVDLGAGTGIISLLALNKKKFRAVYAVEIQKSFAELIERNARLNGLEDSLKTICRDVRLISPELFGGEVDAVFSNPPYMTVNSGFHNENYEKLVARHEVEGTIFDFCEAAKRILKYGGSFYVVYRPDRLCDLLDALRKNTLEPKRMTLVYGSENHAPSLVLIEAKKGAAAGLYLTKPLILTDFKGNETVELSNIYKNGAFDERYERP